MRLTRLTKQQFLIAVPELESYLPHSGIGRVLRSLQSEWCAKVELLPADFKRLPLPLLRNFPYGIQSQADLVFLPRFGGAYGLRDTDGDASLVVVHDLGVIDFPGDRESTDLWSHLSAMQSLRGLRYASQIVAVSQFTRERLLHYMPELGGRVSVILNGVDSLFIDHSHSREDAHKLIGQATGISLRSPLLIYVGSELPRKNIGLLLRAFAELRRQYPAAQLLKVGGPGHTRWRKETLRTMHQLGLRGGDDVVFLEGIDDELLADAYRAADIFVSASLYEGFGLPALEAMAVGTPVVVSNCGSFPEIVGDAGWVTEPTVIDFIAAINQALSADRSSVAHRGRARATQFSWKRAANQYLDTITKLVRASEPEGGNNDEY